MSTITETKEFDKMRRSKYSHKDNSRRSTKSSMPSKQICRYCSSTHPLRQCQTYGKMCTECNKIGHFQKVCRSRRTKAINEVEQETVQGSVGKDIKSVIINSLQLNENCSVLTIKLKTSAGQNNIMVSY